MLDKKSPCRKKNDLNDILCRMCVDIARVYCFKFPLFLCDDYDDALNQY